MRQECFSVYDRKTRYFNVPFFQPTLDGGRRAFIELMSDPSTLPAKYPEDFGLYHVGYFNDNDGQMTGKEPELIIDGVEARVWLEARARKLSQQMEMPLDPIQEGSKDNA